VPTIPARVIATCLALVGFAAAVVVGIAVGNPPTVVLTRATLVMLGCLVIGTIVGKVAQRTIDQHVERHKRDNPIPGQDNPSTSAASSATGAEGPAAADAA
jgi:4-hydroxybenzoate polyprenyltransferase